MSEDLEATYWREQYTLRGEQLAASSAREARLREALADSDALEAVYWKFDAKRKESGEERWHFKRRFIDFVNTTFAALADPPRPVEAPAPCLRCGRPLVCAPCLEATSLVAAPAPRYTREEGAEGPDVPSWWPHARFYSREEVERAIRAAEKATCDCGDSSCVTWAVVHHFRAALTPNETTPPAGPDAVEAAVAELTDLLRANGHALDDSNDYALLRNVLTRRFGSLTPNETSLHPPSIAEGNNKLPTNSGVRNGRPTRTPEGGHMTYMEPDGRKTHWSVRGGCWMQMDPAVCCPATPDDGKEGGK